MTPDEVRMLDNKYALLFIRGERPIMDLKYDILKHPNVAMTTDGKAKAYEHIRPNRSVASVQFDPELLKLKAPTTKYADEDSDFAILTEEEIEELLKENMEENNHEESVSQKFKHI